MIPHDRLTIARNLQRASDLVRFRDVVELYFEQTEYVTGVHQPDWEGARAARAQINRMLPRVIQIVSAAVLSTRNPGTGHRKRGIDALHNMFEARDPGRAEEEVLDLIDMAMGVYQADRFSAWWRTVNPIHYVGVALGFVLGLPRKGLAALGVVGPGSATVPMLQAEHVVRLEDVATRLADGQDSIETRLAEMADRQERQLSENAHQLADLAERLEFAERVMARQIPAGPARDSEDEELPTPV